MNPCASVKKWIVENVQVPVEQFVTQWQQACEQFKNWWTESVTTPLEQWLGSWQQTCVQQDCNWWCLCCNKWLCWLAWVVVKVVTWVVTTVLKWAIYWVCKLVAFVVKLIVMIIVAIGKWVVVFVVCLFTDPLAALKSFRDLWNDVLDVVEEVVDFAKSLLDDVGNLVLDVENLVSSALQGVLGIAQANYVTALFAGLARWALELGRDAIDIVRDLICNLQDIVFGILRLNGCRILAGLTGVATDLGRIVLLILRIPGGLVGGPRDQYEIDEVERIVDDALTKAFEGEALTRARTKVALRNRPFGLPVHIDARRFFISSRARGVNLRALDAEGVIDLSAAADQMTDCSGKPLDRPRWDVVYAGTDTPVDYQTIVDFRKNGPDAVPEFRVYAIRNEMFRRYLDNAVRKGQQIGIRFTYAIGEYEVTQADEVPLPDSDIGNDTVMMRVGRVAGADDLCRPPALAIFKYDNPGRNGLTSWFRPPDSHPSGVTYRERLPEAIFRWVLIHELGHYFGLDHENGADKIMFTADPVQGLTAVTWSSVFELLFLTGEPRFTTDDARTVWAWLTANARACLEA